MAMLLAANANPATTTDLPLYEATRIGLISLVLHDNYTSIDDVVLRVQHGCSCHSVVEVFAAQAPEHLSFIKSDGWAPIHVAANCNRTAIINLLVQQVYMYRLK